MPTEIDDQPFLLADLPPTQGQTRLAIAVVVALVAAFGFMFAFLNVPLRRVDVFIPTLEALCAVNDLITCALLYAQFSISRRWSLLALSSGFLFTALIIVAHALTFPGAFAPEGLLGANTQSSAWLFFFWKVGLTVAVIVYACLKGSSREAVESERAARGAILASVAITAAIACALTWMVTGHEGVLKLLIDDSHTVRTPLLVLGSTGILLTCVALIVLWVRRSCVLDLWLMVVCCTILLEAMTNSIITGRFTFGWYSSRVYSYAASVLLLIVLLSETTTLYANLARSVMRRQGIREAQRVGMDALSISIAHEIRQPLAAISTNASASLRWLASIESNPSAIEEVRSAIKRISHDSDRAAEVISNLRAMFRNEANEKDLLDINDLLREVLATLDLDLRSQKISVSIELADGIPMLRGNRGQLQQVFVNIIANAIEAMSRSRKRDLRIGSSVQREPAGIVVVIEDTGVGIRSEDRNRIFEPFHTTKTDGMGIGLTICHSIVAGHGGTLESSANQPYGTIFQVALPLADNEQI